MDDEENEIWRPIPDAPGYEINQFGEVRRTQTKTVKTKRTPIPSVVIEYYGGRKRQRNVYKLVNEVFPELTDGD